MQCRRDAAAWLTDAELSVYAGEYERNSFAGGLQWYRRGTTGLDTSELQLFAGRTIDVPSMFIAGTATGEPTNGPTPLSACRTRCAHGWPVAT